MTTVLKHLLDWVGDHSELLFGGLAGAALLGLVATVWKAIVNWRMRPRLRFAHRLVTTHLASTGAGKGYGGSLIVGLVNEGRSGVRAPYLAVSVMSPYSISSWELDGNGRSGLPRLVPSGALVRYGGTSEVIIHPGLPHDVTRIDIEVFVDNAGTVSAVPPLSLTYELAAEGMGVRRGEVSIASEDLTNTIVRNRSA